VEIQRIQVSQNFEKNPFKIYKATAIKKVWYWHKNKTINETEQKIHKQIYTCDKMVINKGAKAAQQKKDNLSNK
jgi:peptide subunit release factor 1 (eRF1)